MGKFLGMNSMSVEREGGVEVRRREQGVVSGVDERRSTRAESLRQGGRGGGRDTDRDESYAADQELEVRNCEILPHGDDKTVEFMMPCDSAGDRRCCLHVGAFVAAVGSVRVTARVCVSVRVIVRDLAV